MIELMVICWVLGASTCVVGFHGLFKAEHSRQRKIDRAVERAWYVVERELNPPPPPDPAFLQNMANAQQASNNAYYPIGYMQMNTQQQMRSGVCGSLGLGGLFGL